MRSWWLGLLSVGVLAGCGFASDGAAEGVGGDYDVGTGGNPEGNGGSIPTDAPSPTDAMGPEQNAVDQALLAGDWDDSLNFSPWYTDFRDQYLSYRDDPTIDVTDRTVILVESEQGAPIPNARVSLPGEGPNGLASLGLTATNGKVQHFPSHDVSDPATVGTLFTVQIPGQPDVQELVGETGDGGEVKLVATAFEPTLPMQLDIALVLDTTFSLGDEITYLKNNLDAIDTTIDNAFAGTEVRYGVVAYRDVGEKYTAEVIVDFTPDLMALESALTSVEAEGGGDYPEAVEEGFAQMLSLDWQPGNVARMAFVLGDAPAHEDRLDLLNGYIEDARQQGIRVYPIGASGTGDRAQFFFRQAALMTLGRYLFLTTDTALEDLQAAEDSGTPLGTMPCYLVQDLREVMVRMIASELTGMRQPAASGSIVGAIGGPDATTGLCTFGDGATAQTSAQQP
ncbi:MAG: vWA domain-containing protein [Polyangiaceae bacterium]